MYERVFEFFGLRENPFRDNPDPRYFFFTQSTQEALKAIPDRIRTRKGLILLTGDGGTGKTTLIHLILDLLRKQETPTAFVFNSNLTVQDLFDVISSGFEIPHYSEHKSKAVTCIYGWLIDSYRAGKTPLLIVDEAQGLSDAALREIQRLLNWKRNDEKLLSIVLSGQLELEQSLKRTELYQLRQRISYHCKTAPLSLEQSRKYIGSRLRIVSSEGGPVFSLEAVAAIHLYSRGIPRIVNLLCEHALINAYTDGARPVPARVVDEVATEFQLDHKEALSEVNECHPIACPTLKQLNSVQAPTRSSIDNEAEAQRRDQHATYPGPGPFWQLMAFLSAWLKEPIGSVHWHQIKPCTISEVWVRRKASLFRWLREPMHW